MIAEVLPFTSRTPKSALGLPPYAVEKHNVDLTGTQLEIYDLMASRFRRQLSDADTWRDRFGTLRRARPLRLLQAASNPDLLIDPIATFKSRERQPGTISPSWIGSRPTARQTTCKVTSRPGIVSEIADGGGKVVCWSNFVSNLDQFTRLLQKELGIPTYQIDGRVPAGVDALHGEGASDKEQPGESDTRELIIEKFLNEPGPAVLVTNPASCSESISLHSSCHNAVYLDRTYDCALFLHLLIAFTGWALLLMQLLPYIFF